MVAYDVVLVGTISILLSCVSTKENETSNMYQIESFDVKVNKVRF